MGPHLPSMSLSRLRWQIRPTVASLGFRGHPPSGICVGMRDMISSRCHVAQCLGVFFCCCDDFTLKFTRWRSMNPASSIPFLCMSSAHKLKDLPVFFAASWNNSFHFAMTGLLSAEPSSLHSVASTSNDSAQPPCLQHRYACLKSADQSLIPPKRYRICIKSKVSSLKVHSSAASSISNFTFAGIHGGWMGERSVPITLAFGWSQAKSLAVR